jgi:hypothetical protein
MRRRGAVVPLKRRGPLVERISFGIVRVYLDDIQEIFLILKELTDGVRIQADDFVATEPQDLLDISSETINELTIVATQPNVTVTLSGNTATLEATDADNATLGALKRIEERMRLRRRPTKRLLWYADQPPILVVVAIGLSILALVLTGDVFTGPGPGDPSPPSGSETSIEVGVGWAIGTSAMALLAIVLSVILTARRQAIVIPRFQKDAPPFLRRNRDEIAINAFFTVIGGVLGIVGTLLLQSLLD